MRKLVVAAAFAALALPARLHAQPAPPPTQLWQPSADAPGPKHRRRQHLFISPSGEPFRGRNGFSAWFAQADTNSDGAISAAEFQADAERAFRLFDTNGDGVIDGFELQAYERDKVPEITEFAFGDDSGGRRHHGGHRRGGAQDLDPERNDAPQDVKGAGAEGAARFSLLNEPEPLLAADENVDGKITHAEWMHATARRFATLDKTHAGKLTLDTLQPPAQKGN